jgi:hypothetical protein
MFSSPDVKHVPEQIRQASLGPRQLLALRLRLLADVSGTGTSVMRDHAKACSG